MDPLELTLTEAATALHARQIGHLEYVQASLAHTERMAHLNAWISRDPERLMQQAKALDQNSAAPGGHTPLAGVPLAIKDNIDTADLPTSGGTRALLASRPRRNAAVVERLLQSGGLIAGKTNLHELALGGTTHNAVTGACRNPWNPLRIPGGSSGGSAVAVAARMVPAALGTDTGASVRLPAALCGVVGFRPSTGRYASQGLLHLSPTKDTAGPMARSVADVAWLDALLAQDPSDLPDVSLKGLRLGIPRGDFFEGADPQVLAVIEQALDTLVSEGVICVSLDVPDLKLHNDATGSTLVMFEMMQSLPAYAKAQGLSMDALLAGVGSPDVVRIFSGQLGDARVTATAYAGALSRRQKLQAAYARHFADHRLDALAFPTCRMTAPPVGHDDKVQLGGQAVPTFKTLIRNTDPGSNAGLPGISLPAGLTAEGLPVGLELDGALGSDRHLLAVAAAIERVLPRLPRPPMVQA
ncbi:indoleacetamide hydrolase [Limnohabitans planktonicus]|uniref:Amidase n=1 Tax=Limnohabitans planktonicus II-D5 TaxID=1293045 RepID=A0A2T7UIV1_9BURK|nr:indoleacetamide hydrolase [Limnohabitans planktonicus]PVE44587.1 amidase [Limnohabitans planktonicus II-D5]|eukprot:gene25200-31630_t